MNQKKRGFAILETLLLTGMVLAIALFGFFTFVPIQKQKLQDLNKEKNTYDGIKIRPT